MDVNEKEPVLLDITKLSSVLDVNDGTDPSRNVQRVLSDLDDKSGMTDRELELLKQLTAARDQVDQGRRKIQWQTPQPGAFTDNRPMDTMPNKALPEATVVKPRNMFAPDMASLARTVAELEKTVRGLSR